MISDFSDNDFDGESEIVDDWESLLHNENDDDTSGLQCTTMKDIKAVRRRFKKKVLKIGEADEEKEVEPDADALTIRIKLAEKWSDLKNVSAKNVKLLHEQNPENFEDILHFFQDTMKILPDRENQSKYFSSFITSFVSTVLKAFLQSMNESMAKDALQNTVVRPLNDYKTSSLVESTSSGENIIADLGPVEPSVISAINSVELEYNTEDDFM